MTMTYVVKDQFVGKHSVECIYMQAENISRRIVTSPITLKKDKSNPDDYRLHYLYTHPYDNIE